MEFSGGVPLWKRRAMARLGPEYDPENISLLSKAEAEYEIAERGMYIYLLL